MGTIASQIASLTIVYLTDYSDTDQRKHQSSASLAFVRGIHRGPVDSPHKWPVTRKMFPFDDVIMNPSRTWYFMLCINIIVSANLDYGLPSHLWCSLNQHLKYDTHICMANYFSSWHFPQKLENRKLYCEAWRSLRLGVYLSLSPGKFK